MFQIRPGNQRGHTQISWLSSYHTFSFGDYYAPRHMGFSDLRVINDDIVAPGQGFSLHPHNNMEIISVILSGALEHKDSIGESSVSRAGDVQKMTAGSGVLHSEYNPSFREAVHFLQIWILPEKVNLKPRYEQKSFSEKKLLNKICLIASRHGKKGSVKIYQDAEIYQTILESEQKIDYEILPDRKYWIQIALGSVEANGQLLVAGDGMAIFDESGTLQIRGIDEKSNFLIFNLRP